VERLKYMIIRSKKQYDKYCKMLEILLDSRSKNKLIQEEIDLLTLLIEKWDEEHNTSKEADPIRLLHSLMADHGLKAKDLADWLGMSKGYISDMLHYKKGLSKEVIRKLAERFKLRQDAFNRPYKLKSPINTRPKRAGVMNTTKDMAVS
jgi:HTH-type transcriptional regulator/antitoxin HigA